MRIYRSVCKLLPKCSKKAGRSGLSGIEFYKYGAICEKERNERDLEKTS